VSGHFGSIPLLPKCPTAEVSCCRSVRTPLTMDVCIIASSMGWRNESRSLWTICDFQGEHGWQARKSDNKWGAGMRGGKHMAWQWPIQRWKKVWGYDYSFWFNTRTWQTAGWTDRNRTTVQARPTHRAEKQELSYRKQITRQLCTQYVEGIHRPLNITPWPWNLG